MRCSKQLQIAEAVRAIAARKAEERKHEMEVEIEKVVKTQKEAQSAAEDADREQTAHNKKAEHKLSQRRMPEGLQISPKLGRKKPAHRRPLAKDAQEVIQFERVDFEQVAEKRQACNVSKNDANLAKQSVTKNTQHNVL